MRFQPLFLYELLWDALGFALLLWISRRFKKRLRDGDLLLMYLIWAPTGRFFIEFYRSDSWFFPGTPFDILHVLIAIIVISASSILVLRFIRRKSDSLMPESATESSAAAEAEGAVAPKSTAADQVSAKEEMKTIENQGIGSLGTEG